MFFCDMCSRAFICFVFVVYGFSSLPLKNIYIQGFSSTLHPNHHMSDIAKNK